MEIEAHDICEHYGTTCKFMLELYIAKSQLAEANSTIAEMRALADNETRKESFYFVAPSVRRVLEKISNAENVPAPKDLRPTAEEGKE